MTIREEIYEERLAELAKKSGGWLFPSDKKRDEEKLAEIEIKLKDHARIAQR